MKRKNYLFVHFKYELLSIANRRLERNMLFKFNEQNCYYVLKL